MSPYNNSLMYWFLPSLAVEPKLLMEKQITLNLQWANSTPFRHNDKSPFVYNWKTSNSEQNEEWMEKYSFNYWHRLLWGPEATTCSTSKMWKQALVNLNEQRFQISLIIWIFHHLPLTTGFNPWGILCHRCSIFKGEVESKTSAQRLHFWKVTTWNLSALKEN